MKLGTGAVLRAVVLAAAAVFLAWPLTVPAGVVAAASGALLAGLAAERARSGRLRLVGAALFAALLGTVGVGLARLAVGSSTLAGWLGPVATLTAAEAVRWLFLAAAVVFLLRFAAARRPAAAVAEVAVVAFAFAAAFAAHRGGMIHRPFALGDWAFSRGLDPALVFLGLGGLATLLLAALLVSERQRRRLPLHFAALVAVALALLLIIRVQGLPKPQPAGDLGLTGDPQGGAEEEAGGRERGEGRSDGRRPSDDLEFKDQYGDAGGEAPVAVVVLRDDYSPPSGVYYLRQSVFSQYNGRRLVQATRDDVDRDVVARFPSERLSLPEAPAGGAARVPLRTTVGLLVEHTKPFALDSPRWFEPAPNPNPLRFQRAYDVASEVPVLPYEHLLGRRPGAAGWSDAVWEHYTEAPADLRYRELVDELLAGLRPAYRDDPLARALAIKDYLDREGIYSRRSQHADAADPVGSFLFGDKTGYCVHFAHAATYLLRSAGIPARVAAGYAVPETARAGGSSLMVRGLNAHAWPEIFLEEVGWLVVDITPERTLEAASSPPDQALQRMLGEMMRQPPQSELEELAARRLTWSAVGRALLLALAVVLALAGATKLYRAAVPAWTGPGDLHRLGYRAALDRLAEVGVRRRFGESREAFAARAAAVSPAFVDLTAAHLRAVLGRPAAGDGAVAALRGLVRRSAREVGAAVPRWRRLAGILNPFSWLAAR